MTKSSNGNSSMPYNPDDPAIWYNNPKLKAKVDRIRKQFGEPFLIAKHGEMLYPDCVVLPAFRQGDDDE